MKKFILPVIIVCFAACSPEVVTYYEDVHAMRVSSIYRNDSVYYFLHGENENNDKMAGSYEDRAKEARESNPDKAVYYIKRAITLQPTRDRYLFLAELLQQNKRTEEVNELYNFLTRSVNVTASTGKNENVFVFGEPTKDIYYDYLVSQISRSQTLWAEDIWIAKDYGFNTAEYKERLAADPRLGMDTASETFKNVMLQFLSDEEFETVSRMPDMLNRFFSSAPDSSLEFAIDKKNVWQFDYSKLQDEEMDYMRVDLSNIFVYNLLEKRLDKSNYLNYNLRHTLPLSKEYKAVIYAVDTSNTACPAEMRHIYHRLVTYTNNGDIIDNKVVACQSGEDLVTADFKHAHFALTSYKRKWKEAYNKTQYENEIVEISKSGEQVFEITNDGHIKEIL